MDEVEILTAPQRWLAAVTFTCAPDELATEFAAAFVRVNTALLDLGVEPTGPLIGAYRRTADAYEVGCGYEVEGEFAATGELVAFSLPAGDVARLAKDGEGSDTEASYEELEMGALMQGREVVPDSPTWEEYWDDPKRTVIYWPLKPADT